MQFFNRNGGVFIENKALFRIENIISLTFHYKINKIIRFYPDRNKKYV